MNLRPSGYEPDELPDCSTPRAVVDEELRPGEAILHGQLAGAICPGQVDSLSLIDRVGAGLGRPGGALLFRGLSRSTIGAEGFHGRVRDGIGWGTLAMATRPAKPRRRPAPALLPGGLRIGCVCLRGPSVWADVWSIRIRESTGYGQFASANRPGMVNSLTRIDRVLRCAWRGASQSSD